ncbi:MAG TPA: hypothetical protein PKK26_11095 [Candidatus Wallbacteria bacterium]|nr:hypothetical protein [Candidatus Wallbacteria bacterium]
MNTNNTEANDNNTEFTEEQRSNLNVNLTNFFNLKSGEVNVKSLDPSEIGHYIERMIFVIGRVSELFNNAKKYNFQVPVEKVFDTRSEFIGFIDSLILFFMALKYKFLLQNKGVNTTSLSIDPTDSGFPHFTDLWNFKNDVECAAEQLAAMPSREEVLTSAVDSIFRGEFPVREQLLYARRNYFDFIKGENIISDFKVNKPVLMGSGSGESLYKINFYGFDERYNIFNFYSMLLTQADNTSEPLKSTSGHRLFAAIKDFYKQDLFKLAHYLDDLDPLIHPKVLIKYTAGPYYSKSTLNADNINAVLNIAPGDPFIFKFNISGIMSIKTIKESSVVKKFVNNLFGYANSKEIFSEKFENDYMVVPFKLKQFLRDRNEAGKPCRIFGVLDGGELVE